MFLDTGFSGCLLKGMILVRRYGLSYDMIAPESCPAMKSALLGWRWCRIQICPVFNHEPDSRCVKSMSLSANPCCISFFHSLKFFIFAFYRSCRCIDPATWSEPFLRVLTVELREAPCRRSQFRPWILVWFTPHSSGSSRCSPSGSWITVLRFLVQSPIISEGSVRCSATHRRTRRHFVNSSKYASMFEEFPVICVFHVKLASWCSSARSFWVVSLITTNLNLKDRGPCLEWMRMISDRSNVFLMSRYLDIVVQF